MVRLMRSFKFSFQFLTISSINQLHVAKCIFITSMFEGNLKCTRWLDSNLQIQIFNLIKYNLFDSNVMDCVLADPTPPGPIEILRTTTNSVEMRWGEAPMMSLESNYSYKLTYNSSQPDIIVSSAKTNYTLSQLLSGTSYNISVKTVGPLGFESESVYRNMVTTSKNFIILYQLPFFTILYSRKLPVFYFDQILYCIIVKCII